MADPFDALRQPVVPLSPRPEFAAALRARLGALLEPPAPPQVRSLRPYLSVADGAAAIEWYKGVFGAEELERITGPDGRVAHCELRIGAATFMLAEEYLVEDVISPTTAGGTTAQMLLDVTDCETVFGRAVAAGARVWRPIGDTHRGARGGKIRDPWGHNWFIETAPAPDRTGDLFYFTWRMGDVAADSAFFTALLGWEYSPAHVDGVTVTNINQPIGLRAGGSERIRLWFCVTDIDGAVGKVRELGGQAAEPVRNGAGWMADCVTPDGVEFSLSVPAAGY